jgi:hypothetical protein
LGLQGFLEEADGFRADAVQLLQLGGGHVRQLAEVGVPGRGQGTGGRGPDVARQSGI